MKYLALITLALLSGCGKAQFAGRTQPTSSVESSLATGGSDYYLEIGQEFSNEMAGQIDVTNVILSGKASWTGNQSAQVEMRVSLTGQADVNGFVFSALTPPEGWSSATPVFNQNVPGGSSLTTLQSGNLKDSFTTILANKRFWVLVRMRGSALDPLQKLTITEVQAYAEGEKSLRPLSPLINLSF